jgi:hypothetical protein
VKGGKVAVATLEEALDNLIKGVTGKGKKYDAKQPTMVSNFNGAFGKFGISLGPVTKDAYDKGTRGKGAVLERNAIDGAKRKWIPNYKAGLSI